MTPSEVNFPPNPAPSCSNRGCPIWMKKCKKGGVQWNFILLAKVCYKVDLAPHGYGSGWSRRHQARTGWAGSPSLAWIRAWLFLKKLKCVFETKSNGSLDIRALAAQRPPTRRPTIAGAHRRPDTRPKEPFLGLKRRETKRKSCPMSKKTKNGHAARFSGSVVNGWKGRF